MKGSVRDGATGPILTRLGRLIPTRDQWRVLGERLEKVIVEDNRKGVLAGLDRNGNPLAKVTYRAGVSIAVRFRRANSPGFGTVAGRFQGRSTRFSKRRGELPNNNLTTAEYRKLHGPPLAPRGERSRVITNLVTRTLDMPTGVVAEAGWRDVLSARGTPFLRYHFRGSGRLPRRDLRGVRPEGMALARRTVNEWVRWLVRG